MAREPKTLRIQFDIDASQLTELDAIQQQGGFATRKEMFNNAVTLLKWALSQRAEGRTIASVDETAKSYRELQMPCLEHAASSAANQA